MKLIITRHGETDYNVKGILQGQKQSKLTKNGIKQAKALAERLKDEKIDVIYTSELKRSIDTSNIVNKYHKIKIIKTNLLNERAYGDFEGKYGDKIYDNIPNFNERDKKLRFTPPGKGESVVKLKKRIKKFLKILPKYKNILIVGHSGTNKMILTILLKKSLKEWTRLKQDPTCISIVSKKGRKFILEKTNDTNHLKKAGIKKIKDAGTVY